MNPGVSSPVQTATGDRVSLRLVNVQPCDHKGELLSRPASCPLTWVYGCEKFGTCTLTQCENCPAYVCASDKAQVNADPKYRRHLMYYVYPVASDGGKLWRAAVDSIKRRLDLFNGRRVISIATASARHHLDPPEQVRAYLGNGEADYLYVGHGAKRLGEVTAFVPMLERLKLFTTPRDVTFYGHTKGVTKAPSNPAVHRWAELMYRSNLDYWGKVREELTSHPITGAFRKFGRAFGGAVERHYTGTFYWFRNADVFARKWRIVPQRYGGTEMWPGMMFSREEFGCHFYDATGKILYDPRHIDDAERELATWR